jgi:hypothetical protein
MTITLKELVVRPMKIPDEHFDNLNLLMFKLNKLRDAYGKPLQVTSGYRSMEHHLAIYAAKGITDKKKIPMKSRHLYGLAADLVPVEDSIEHLHDWVLDNMKFCEEVGLWLEAMSATPTWLHVQIVPPKSGVRIFFP